MSDDEKDKVAVAEVDAGEKKEKKKRSKDKEVDGEKKKKKKKSSSSKDGEDGEKKKRKKKSSSSKKEGEDGEKKKKKKKSSSSKKEGEDGEKKKKKKKSSSSKDGEDGEKKKRKKKSSSSKKEGEDGEKKKKKKKSSSSKKDGEDGEKKKKKKKRRKRADVPDEEDMSEGDPDDPRPIGERYEVGRQLGCGAFSVVKLATSKRSGKKYAVKIIEKANAGQDMARLRTEMEILKSVRHQNIIALKEIIEDDDTLYIITELVTGGELFDKIVELGAYTEADAAELVAKMVSAIDYLHKKNIVHRDLKPENLLLKDEDDVSEIKLADFGLSKIVGNKVMMQTACGTPGYVAPEVLQASPYDKEVDLWSIGVITYILLCGFPPFYNESLPLLFEQIMKADYDYPPDYWDEISESAKNFIDRLLVVEPSERMTAEEALQHEWLAGSASNKKLRTKERMGESMRKWKDQSSSAKLTEG
eukprot:TRINITY_DN1483_c0_g1_i1.p1 TRINITY_DN1483_c0_g1~~TRINITY_DN1483_c0_g1_i1.p1  ORF type:complete len:472 (+),score=291.09 TRINITY_DN1483_c0_g1_i1:43-1458(+)